MTNTKFTKIAMTALLTSTMHYSAYATTNNTIEFQGEQYVLSTPDASRLRNTVAECPDTQVVNRKLDEQFRSFEGVPSPVLKALQQSSATILVEEKEANRAKLKKDLIEAQKKKQIQDTLQSRRVEIDALTTSLDNLKLSSNQVANDLQVTRQLITQKEEEINILKQKEGINEFSVNLLIDELNKHNEAYRKLNQTYQQLLSDSTTQQEQLMEAMDEIDLQNELIKKAKAVTSSEPTTSLPLSEGLNASSNDTSTSDAKPTQTKPKRKVQGASITGGNDTK